MEAARQGLWRAIHISLATESEKWIEASDASRVLWIQLMLKSDSYGAIEGDGLLIWALLTRRLGWDLDKTEAALEQLVELGLITRFPHGANHWIQIESFDAHQPAAFIRKRGERKSPVFAGKVSHGMPDERPQKKNKKKNKKKRIIGEGIQPEQIKAVFDHWVEIDVATGGGNASGRILNAARKEKIRARLNEGYTVDQINSAITAYCNDPWHLGKNPQRKRYTGLVTLIKTGEKIEAGLQIATERAASQNGRANYVAPQAIV